MAYGGPMAPNRKFPATPTVGGPASHGGEQLRSAMVGRRLGAAGPGSQAKTHAMHPGGFAQKLSVSKSGTSKMQGTFGSKPRDPVGR